MQVKILLIFLREKKFDHSEGYAETSLALSGGVLPGHHRRPLDAVGRARLVVGQIAIQGIQRVARGHTHQHSQQSIAAFEEVRDYRDGGRGRWQQASGVSVDREGAKPASLGCGDENLGTGARRSS